MTFSSNGSFEGETRLAQITRPSEDSQRMSVQVGSSMDQFNSIRDLGKKSTADLPDLALFDKSASNEKQLILVKDKKEYLLENPPDKNDGQVILNEKSDKSWLNPPDKNDGYMIAGSMHKVDEKQTAHNKQVFREVDSNHNGRLSLEELKVALTEPESDLTKKDRVQLMSQANQILKHLEITNSNGDVPTHAAHRYDPTLRQYLDQNHLAF